MPRRKATAPLLDDAGNPIEPEAAADKKPEGKKRAPLPKAASPEAVRRVVEGVNALLSLTPASPYILRGPMGSVQPEQTGDEIGLLSTALHEAQQEIPVLRRIFGAAGKASAGIKLVGIAGGLLYTRLGLAGKLPRPLQEAFNETVLRAQQQAAEHPEFDPDPSQNGYNASSAGSVLAH